MNDAITLSVPLIQPTAPIASKWAQEYQAFRRLLPQLLQTHNRKYVAIHEGRVVDEGEESLPLALRVLGKIGNVDIHVGLVTDQVVPPARSGVRRELPQAEAVS